MQGGQEGMSWSLPVQLPVCCHVTSSINVIGLSGHLFLFIFRRLIQWAIPLWHEPSVDWNDPGALSQRGFAPMKTKNPQKPNPTKTIPLHQRYLSDAGFNAIKWLGHKPRSGDGNGSVKGLLRRQSFHGDLNCSFGFRRQNAPIDAAHQRRGQHGWFDGADPARSNSPMAWVSTKIPLAGWEWHR